MAGKLHLRPNGDAGACTAQTEDRCPYQSTGHFDTAEELYAHNFEYFTRFEKGDPQYTEMSDARDDYQSSKEDLRKTEDRQDERFGSIITAANPLAFTTALFSMGGSSASEQLAAGFIALGFAPLSVAVDVVSYPIRLAYAAKTTIDYNVVKKTIPAKEEAVVAAKKRHLDSFERQK